jgi:3-oxoacyl-[acyl-carrier protein] reductase
MDLQLGNKTALVTGASAGIGQGIARCLAREGVRLVISARREPALRSLATELEAAGARQVVTLAADIADPAAADAMADAAERELGQIDVLINCAGASGPTTIASPDEEWERSMALNFTAMRRLAHRLVPGMQARGFGRVVNISGTMEPRALNTAGAAKAALHHWSKALASVVAKDGVTVNTIAPGRIWSEQIRNRLHADEQQREAFIKAEIPIGRFGEPEELGVVATFLASPLAGYVTGVVIPVDGGMARYQH